MSKLTNLIKQNRFGRTIYTSSDNSLEIVNVDDLWYIKDKKSGKPRFNAGLVNISAVNELIQNIHSYTDQLSMLGYETSNYSNDYFREADDNLEFSKVTIGENSEDDLFTIDSIFRIGNKEFEDHFKTSTFNKLIDHIIRTFDKYNVQVFASVIYADADASYSKVLASIKTLNKQSVMAAISSKDITKDMVKVKSSNIWSIAMDIRDKKDKNGTMYIQFKGKSGGPGELYCYYDVPIKLWRAFITAPSKGHFFHVNFRNALKYSHLSGDKKTKLPNGIN